MNKSIFNGYVKGEFDEQDIPELDRAECHLCQTVLDDLCMGNGEICPDCAEKARVDRAAIVIALCRRAKDIDDSIEGPAGVYDRGRLGAIARMLEVVDEICPDSNLKLVLVDIYGRVGREL